MTKTTLITTFSVPFSIIIKHFLIYLQKPPLLVDVYICQDEPSMISTKNKKIPKENVIRDQQNIQLKQTNKQPSAVEQKVTFRYCFFTSSIDESNDRFRCSNGFNLKQARILF